MAAHAGVCERVSSGVLQGGPEGEQDRALTAFEEGLGLLSAAVEEAAYRERTWVGRVRCGLVALLGFLDDEPAWSRLLAAGVPVGGPIVALRCEQRTLAVLTALLDDGAPQAVGELMPDPQLTGEFVVAGVFSVIRKRILEDDDEPPLVCLAPSLLAFILTPYGGQALAGAHLADQEEQAGRSSMSGRGAQ
jgi:hypothetical protein